MSKKENQKKLLICTVWDVWDVALSLTVGFTMAFYTCWLFWGGLYKRLKNERKLQEIVPVGPPVSTPPPSRLPLSCLPPPLPHFGCLQFSISIFILSSSDNRSRWMMTYLYTYTVCINMYIFIYMYSYIYPYMCGRIYIIHIYNIYSHHSLPVSFSVQFCF